MDAPPRVQLHDGLVGVLNQAGIRGSMQLFLYSQRLFQQFKSLQQKSTLWIRDGVR